MVDPFAVIFQLLGAAWFVQQDEGQLEGVEGGRTHSSACSARDVTDRQIGGGRPAAC